LLLELAEDYGKQNGTEIDLTIKLSHQDLASIIGSTRETVTVTLGQLQAEGLIKVGRRRISLADTNRLAASARVTPPSLQKEQPRHPPLGGKQGVFG
jgi:Mn-dependent DtxR family transcriptional regulator